MRQFKQTLSHLNPLIRDHRINGQRVLPGVVYLDMCARCLGNEQFSLSNIRYPAALIIAGNASIDVYLEFDESSSNITIYHWQDRSKIIHFSAIYHPFYHNKAHITPDAHSDLMQSKSMQSIYQLAADRFIEHGPFMQVVGTTTINAQTIKMDLQLSQQAQPYINQFYLHPALLDGATFAIASLHFEAVSQLDKEQLYLPLSIEQVDIYRRIDQSNITVIAEKKPASNGLIKCDMTIQSTDGNPYVHISGLCNKQFHINQFFDIRSENNDQAQQYSNQTLEQTVLSVLSKYIDQDILNQSKTISFFDLGVDSGQLMACATQLEQSLSISIYPTLLFEYNTTEKLIAYLATIVDQPDEQLDIKQTNQSSFPQNYALFQPSYKRLSLPETPEPSHNDIYVRTSADELPVKSGNIIDKRYLNTNLSIEAVIADLSSQIKHIQSANVCLLIQLSQRQQALFAALHSLVLCFNKESKHVQLKLVLSDQTAPYAFADLFGMRDSIFINQNNGYFAPGTEPIKPQQNNVLEEKGRYLIIGGGPGLSQRLRSYLIDNYQASISVIGHRSNDPSCQAQHIPYQRIDTANLQEIEQYLQTSAPFDGIFFLSGVKQDGLLSNAALQTIDDVLSVKPYALQNLLIALPPSKTKFVCTFSSLSADIGQPGQTVYAAANGLLNYYAKQAELNRIGSGKGPRVISISWPYWQEGGMQLAPELVEQFSQQYATAPLSTDRGFALLEQALGQDNAHLIVANDNLLAEAESKLQTTEPLSIQKEALTEFNEHDVAIIGISFQLPDANDFEQLHNNLSQGLCSIKPVSRQWSQVPYQWGGYLDNIDQFDPLFFNISPNEAKLMDPQERLFLANAWHCLEDAGYAGKDPQNIGVIAAAMFNSYQNYGVENSNEKEKPQSIIAAIANRVSYVCNLTGPSFSVDSMCSSSINALDLACQLLISKPVDAMMVGAVNICSHPYKLAALKDNKFLSPNGQSMPFSNHANGYVPGEGVVVLLLKKAKQALADGDTIYGVIKAIASSHGGLGKGYTVPSTSAQAQTIKQALDQANLPNTAIDYVEAHGTGTALGDPIEVAALHQIFNDSNKPLYFGSIKSNIGHLEPVAGFASLMKVLCQFRNKTIYPSIHTQPLNEQLKPYLGNLQVSQALQSGVDTHFAGISCFGAGGSNTYCIVKNVQKNLINRFKTNYDTQSHWIKPTQTQSKVDILTCSYHPEPIEQSASELIEVFQQPSNLIPTYFYGNIDTASIHIYAVSKEDCWQGTWLSNLIDSMSKSPTRQYLILANCKSSWMMSHALIASSATLAQAKIKCLYIQDRQSYSPEDIGNIVEQEVLTFNHNMVIYTNGQRQIPAFERIVRSKPSGSFSTSLKVAVLGGLGGIGLQFCRALLNLGVERFDIFGRSPRAKKQSELSQLATPVRYISHDFISAAYPTERYDLVINCLGLMPNTQLSDQLQRQELKQNLQCFIEQAKPGKLISISSLSVIAGFNDEPNYAVDSASIHSFSEYCGEHVVLYCPLILTSELSQQASQQWLDWSEKNQGLSVFTLEALYQICPTLMTLPAGEYIPFVGVEQQLQTYLRDCLAVKETNTQQPVQVIDNRSLLSIIEAILGIPRDKINSNKTFQELGFTSLTLASFAEQLSESFAIDFNPSQFFELHTVNDLNQYLGLEAESHGVQIVSKQTQKEVIVICGYECEFPSCNSAEHYWQNLENGIECTQSSITNRFSLSDNASVMGLLEGIDQFDHRFFDISPQEAKYIDPQQRKLLQLSWHIFENAGIAPLSMKGKEVGVFVAIQFDDYARLVDRQNTLDLYQITGCAKNFSANRLSYYYDFHGPSETIDTACSSSMSALDRAIQSLRQHECDYALVMGVSLLSCLKTYELTQQLQILSRQGHCRPFDAEADGYVKGEGVAGLLLTREMIAKANHLRVDGIVSGLAVNHGGRAQSITAPNIKAQQVVMKKAIANSDLSVQDIDYIEAHATATKLGDPVEYQAIATVFADGNEIGLGSVKANIGHTEPVAGLAGIIKALKMLANQKIPKQINYTRTNPYIDLKKPFYINQETLPKHLKHIGINSFGFGGSNGHCIISHYSQKTPKEMLPLNVFILSAKTAEGLAALQQSWLSWLTQHPQANLTSICKTLSVGRAHFQYRASWVVDSIDSLKKSLSTNSLWENVTDSHDETPLKTQPIQALKTHLNKLAKAYMNGVDIHWHQVYQGIETPPLVLPNYPFVQTRHWLDETQIIEEVNQRPSLDIYTESWLPVTISKTSVDKLERRLFIVKPVQIELITSLIDQNQLVNASILQVDSDFELNLINEMHKYPSRIYYLSELCEPHTDALESTDYPYHQTVLKLLQVIEKAYLDEPLNLYFMTHKRDMIGADTVNQSNPIAFAMFGFVQSFSKENPHFRCHCLNLLDISNLAEAVDVECPDASLYHYDGMTLFKRSLLQQPQLEASATMKDKIIVLTGGNGQVGRLLTPEILKDKPSRCICLSRTPLDTNLDIEQHAVDCTNFNQFAKAIQLIIDRYQRIDYLIHLSANYQESPIKALLYCDYLKQMEAKVWGTQHCLTLSKLDAVKRVVICSSVQVYTQNENRGAYTASCFYSDALVDQFKSEKVNLIHWGFWQQADQTLNEVMQEAGIFPINGKQGYRALLQCLSSKYDNASCFSVTDVVKAFMPIASNYDQAEIPAIQFHQQLQQLEYYAADLIWSSLLASGAIFIKDSEVGLNFNFIAKEYKAFVANLVSQVTEFASTRGHTLKAFNPDQLLLKRRTQFRNNQGINPYLNLLEHCVAHLSQVISKQLSPQKVLFPAGSDELVRGVYQFNPLALYYNRLVAKEVHHLCDMNNELSILEVGAGTGATTQEILIDGYYNLDYTFSDINEAFFKAAQTRFKQCGHIKFERFDINYDSADESYDIIIASNVLHTCDDLPSTLERLSHSLKPGGRIIINEAVEASLFLNATFGLLPQWHQPKTDARIKGCPLLTIHNWQKILEQCGFNVTFSKSSSRIEQAVIIACLNGRLAPTIKPHPSKDNESTVNSFSDDNAEKQSFSQLIAQILNMVPESIDQNRSLKSYGVDSLAAIHLTQAIKRSFNIDLSPTRLLGDESIKQFIHDYDLEY